MELNRRSFLKKALAAGTGSLFSACTGIRRSDLPGQNLAGPTANQLDVVGNSSSCAEGRLSGCLPGSG